MSFSKTMEMVAIYFMLDGPIQSRNQLFFGFLGVFEFLKESGSIEKKQLINEQRMYFFIFPHFVNNIFLDETSCNGENIFQFLGCSSASYSRLVKITGYFVVQVPKFNNIF